MPPKRKESGRVAGHQDNVVSREQLFELGVGRRVIARQLESGRWQCLHRGIYLIGPAPPALSARARAAALACGEGAVVGHRTAAELWALLPPEADTDIHVTVCRRNPGTRNGIHTHRVRRLPEEEVTIKRRHPPDHPRPHRLRPRRHRTPARRRIRPRRSPDPPPRHRRPAPRGHPASPDPPRRPHHPQTPQTRGRLRLHPIQSRAPPTRPDPTGRPRTSTLQ